MVEAHQSGQLTESTAVDQVAQQGFGDVLPRFHTVNGSAVPLQFYEHTSTGLVLTDALLGLFGAYPRPDLQAEVLSRWDLLEAAFAMHLPIEVLGTDEHMLYRSNGTRRIDITGTVPVLNGYQNGQCFYCGGPLEQSSVHVDHVIPRTFLQHDEIWNLVLVHDTCNLAKSARLPTLEYLEKLAERNEYYIASNHPIRQHLLHQLGKTARERCTFLERTYSEAQRVLVHVWPGYPAARRCENPLSVLHLTEPA